MITSAPNTKFAGLDSLNHAFQRLDVAAPSPRTIDGLDLASHAGTVPSLTPATSSASAGDLISSLKPAAASAAKISISKASYQSLKSESAALSSKQAWHQAIFLNTSLAKSSLGQNDYLLHLKALAPLEAVIEAQDAANTVGPFYLAYTSGSKPAVQGLRLDILRKTIFSANQLFESLEDPEVARECVEQNGAKVLDDVRQEAVRNAALAAQKVQELTRGIFGHVSAHLQDPYIKSDPKLANRDALPDQIRAQLQIHDDMLAWPKGQMMKGKVWQAENTKEAILSWNSWREGTNQELEATISKSIIQFARKL